MAEKEMAGMSTVLWRIENLSFWNEIHDWKISSPEFQLCNHSKNKWTICLLLGGRDEDDETTDEDDEERDESEDEEGYGGGTHTIFSFRPSLYKRPVSMNCEWSLLDGNGSLILTRKEKYETKHAKCKHKMPDCPTYKDLFQTRKSLLPPLDTLTVRLRVWDSEENFTEVDHITAVTRLKVHKESFKWRIEKFKILPLHKKVITSISVGGDVFRLVFSLTGASLSDASVNFEILTVSSREQFLTVQLTVLGQEETKPAIKDTHIFKSSILEQTWVAQILLSRQEILQHLFDDDLILLCSFNSVLPELQQCIEKSYYGPTNLNPDNTRNVPPLVENGSVPRTIISSLSESRSESNSLTIFQEDLHSLYKYHAFSDFELRTGDVSIPVHKGILSARSPVFRAMFSSDKESDSNSHEVPDVDVHTLNRMLSFLYAGTMEPEMKWENAAKLFYAADKYEIFSLKQECSSVLKSHITISNVVAILELADRHRDEMLTLCVHDFIGNHFDDVIRSNEWGNFLERSCLAGKTLKEVYMKRASK